MEMSWELIDPGTFENSFDDTWSHGDAPSTGCFLEPMWKCLSSKGTTEGHREFPGTRAVHSVKLI